MISGKRPKPIEKTLSDRVAELLTRQNPLPLSYAGIVNPISFMPCSDYSQKAVLKKINLYFKSVNQKLISEKGYCHGIVLLWLTFMSLGAEALLYKMIKMIVECPLLELAKLEPLIQLFFSLIDVGQFPECYSNGRCGYQNVNEIIGDVSKQFSASRKFTQAQMINTIQTLAKKNNMIVISGWWRDSDSPHDEGHTVGVFVRDQQYHYFNCNAERLGDLQFLTERILVQTIWDSIYEDLKVRIIPRRREKFFIHAAHRLKSPTIAPISRPSFFSLSYTKARKNTSQQVVCTKLARDSTKLILS